MAQENFKLVTEYVGPDGTDRDDLVSVGDTPFDIPRLDEDGKLPSSTLPGGGDLMITVTLVDLNTDTPTALYTVPTGKRAHIVTTFIGDSTASLDTVLLSIGWNSPDFDDVTGVLSPSAIADGTRDKELVPASKSRVVGAAGDTLNLLCAVPQGVPATVTVYVKLFLTNA
jgi:hypothetical protein